MRARLAAICKLAVLSLFLLPPAPPLSAQPMHGIAMYGDPALPPDFVHLPHANPDAPQGGRITFAEIGSFDSLNPFIRLGTAPWGVNLLSVESLMGRSYDEPFTLYGVLAESIETSESRDRVTFTLRPEARFSDGSAVTVEDVMWSFRIMGEEGHARYRNAWARVASMEQTGPRSLTFTFTEADREMPLILGLRPVIQRAQFDEAAGGRPFAASSLQPVIGSGPYVVDSVDPGRAITFRRNPDHWARDLPFYRGQHNLAEVRYEYYGDASVAFEGFKAGAISVWRETNAARWSDSYDFPAMAEGRIRRAEIPHGRPSGMNGFVFNTRRAPFDDWRMREALIHLFDFERINAVVNGGLEPRIESYFGNSPLGMGQGPAQGRVAELLRPFAPTLLPGALEGYALPLNDSPATIRRNFRTALRLMAEAGWEPGNDGRLRNAGGQALSFEILLRQGSAELLAVANTWIAALESAGIEVRISTVDPAQYVERTNAYDFDVTHFLRFMSLSPGNEQRLYWGREGVSEPGSRNLAGVDDPAVEAMIATLLETDDSQTFTAAAQALDRVLMAGRYVVPLWYPARARLAIAQGFHFPERLPLYGDWTGFLPEVWWYQTP